MKKPIVYIAHPIGAVDPIHRTNAKEQVALNVKKVLSIVRQLSIENEVIPFAPYIVDVQALDDANPIERGIGFTHNMAMFERGIIDEVWLYGGRISNGMATEVKWAEVHGILVKQMWCDHCLKSNRDCKCYEPF